MPLQTQHQSAQPYPWFVAREQSDSDVSCCRILPAHPPLTRGPVPAERRLEDYKGSGEEALKAFDARLASAAAVLRRAGFWEETVGRGGSSTSLLQLARTASSTPPEVRVRCRALAVRHSS